MTDEDIQERARAMAAQLDGVPVGDGFRITYDIDK
jgi:hypothetical protein